MTHATRLTAPQKHRRAVMRTAFCSTPAFAALSFLSTATAPPSSAFCISGMSRWVNDRTYVAAISTGFPTSMRSGTKAAALAWNNVSGSSLKTGYTVSASYATYPLQIRYQWPTTLSDFVDEVPGWASKGGAAGKYNQTWDHVYLNPTFTWVNGSQNIGKKIADVQTVVIHELGHVHGLAHPAPGHCTDGTAYTSAEKISVMTAINTGTRRNLTADDVAGISALY